MPLYDYECAACGRRFEVFQGVHADAPTECPLCGKGPVRKVITAAAVHYRGSGWAKKERRSAAGSKGGSSAKDDTAGDEGSKETSKDSSAGEGATAGSTTSSSKGKSSGKSGKTTDTSAAATGD